ncbi:MAG: divalent metal cation transporter [Acidobacteria bacterium]|nr:divalent metal cation transporter [Acidobacteriota bacterium]
MGALLGPTISPHVFLWQYANRRELMRDEPVGGPRVAPLKEKSDQQARFKRRTRRVDVLSDMVFSNIVMFTIIATTGPTLHAHGITNLPSAAPASSSLKAIATVPSTARSTSHRAKREDLLVVATRGGRLGCATDL